MKKILFILLSFIFFATQIVPLSYIGYVLSDEDCEIVVLQVDEEEGVLKKVDNSKADIKFISKFCNSANNANGVDIFNPFCYNIFNERFISNYFNDILVPPPNC